MRAFSESERAVQRLRRSKPHNDLLGDAVPGGGLHGSAQQGGDRPVGQRADPELTPDNQGDRWQDAGKPSALAFELLAVLPNDERRFFVCAAHEVTAGASVWDAHALGEGNMHSRGGNVFVPMPGIRVHPAYLELEAAGLLVVPRNESNGFTAAFAHP